MGSRLLHDISDLDYSDCEYVTLEQRLGASTGRNQSRSLAGNSWVLCSDVADVTGLVSSETLPEHTQKDCSCIRSARRSADWGLTGEEQEGVQVGERCKRATGFSTHGKLHKKARSCQLRDQRPDKCDKFLEVLVSAGVEAVDGGVQLLEHLRRDAASSVTSVRQLEPCLASSVMWRRRVNLYRVEKDQVVSSSTHHMDPHLVLVFSAGFMNSAVEVQRVCSTVKHAVSEFSTMTEGEVRTTLLCCGILKSDLAINLSCCLLTTAHCCVHVADTPLLAATFLVHMTRSVALAPHRRSQSAQQFTWFADSCKSVKIDGHLRGLKQLWLEQLRQLPASSLAAAGCVAKEFPSHALLRKAYAECSSEEECETLISELQIQRFSGPLSSQQAIGSELSRRLYVLFSTTEGNTLL